MREPQHVPTVDEIRALSEAEEVELMHRAKTWPPAAIESLIKNFRAAADRDFHEADQLQAFKRRRPVNDNQPDEAA